MGLVADHTGAARVAHALFGGGERRACKPQRAFATAPDAAPGVETTYDMVIQSLALWPEQMYLDRVTVRDGKARAPDPLASPAAVLATPRKPRTTPRTAHPHGPTCQSCAASGGHQRCAVRCVG